MAQAAASRGLIEVVDDDEGVLETVSAVLRLEGYEVAAAQHAGCLLADLHRHPPDLILLDLMMPQISGIKLLAMIRARPAFQHIPIIVISAAGPHRHMRELALQHGAQGFLAKPFYPEDLPQESSSCASD